jgi:hypothetical protein
MFRPPEWTAEQLEAFRVAAISNFRKQRMEEPLEKYLSAFERFRSAAENLLETTVDLTQIDDQLLEVVTDPELLEMFRYIAGPPISEDDLKILAEASLAPTRLRSDAAMARRVVEVVMIGLDRRRFPWVRENREPSPDERMAAIIASAALLAAQRAQTDRRSDDKREQEGLVESILIGAGFQKSAFQGPVLTIAGPPAQGEYYTETLVGTRKADFIIRLWDSRLLLVECKVSNSATNSIKRLNNDAAAKAEAWRHDFGDRQVVPSAVLSGVYKLEHLLDAQRRGLALFWAHDLASLVTFIEATRTHR